jgi:hypothetical protein
MHQNSNLQRKKYKDALYIGERHNAIALPGVTTSILIYGQVPF